MEPDIFTVRLKPSRPFWLSINFDLLSSPFCNFILLFTTILFPYGTFFLIEKNSPVMGFWLFILDKSVALGDCSKVIVRQMPVGEELEEWPQGVGGGAEGEDWALGSSVLPVATIGVGPEVAKWSWFQEVSRTIFFPRYVFEIWKLYRFKFIKKKKKMNELDKTHLWSDCRHRWAVWELLLSRINFTL